MGWPWETRADHRVLRPGWRRGRRDPPPGMLLSPYTVRARPPACAGGAHPTLSTQRQASVAPFGRPTTSISAQDRRQQRPALIQLLVLEGVVEPVGESVASGASPATGWSQRAWCGCSCGTALILPLHVADPQAARNLPNRPLPDLTRQVAQRPPSCDRVGGLALAVVHLLSPPLEWRCTIAIATESACHEWCRQSRALKQAGSPRDDRPAHRTPGGHPAQPSPGSTAPRSAPEYRRRKHGAGIGYPGYRVWVSR